MQDKVIEGVWEDLISREDLRGRTVRIVVLDQQPQDDPWLKSLNNWANSHEPLANKVDDSRESIYTGTVDDPR